MESCNIQLHLTLISDSHRDPVATLIKQLYGKQQVYGEPGTCVLQLKQNTLLQLSNPGAQPPAYLAEALQPIISLAVTNLGKAIRKGIMLGAVVAELETDACSGHTRCYLQWPDGRVLGLWQERNKRQNLNCT